MDGEQRCISGCNNMAPLGHTAACWKLRAEYAQIERDEARAAGNRAKSIVAAQREEIGRLVEALEWIQEGLDRLYSETNPHGLKHLPEALVPYTGPIASMHKTALIALAAAASAAPAAREAVEEGEPDA